jgi:hypothetical protein
MRNPTTLEQSLAPTFSPSVNLVPFRTRLFSDARVALLNHDFPSFAEDEFLSTYGYGVATRSSRSNMTGATKVFFAERYGSLALMGHGGGGRVGADAEFQVKGIGATPVLASRGVNFCYRNGEMLLAEAVRETIWGDILNIALPYGAVRSPGVISTGTICSLPENDTTGVKLERGLHVRENAVRLAHFTRAPFFKPSGRRQASWIHDHDRVVTAMSEIGRFLPPVSGDEALKHGERLTARLTGMAERLAAQLAAARARRLVHGALVHSNFCLDGRWIDYGSTHWSPVHATGKHFAPPFWNDEGGTVLALHNFAWQLKKYLTKGEGPDDHDWLVSIFRKELDFRQKVEFLGLTGFSEQTLSTMNVVDFSAGLALGMAVLAVARSGRNCRFTGEDDQLAGYGDYDTGKILASLLVTTDEASAERLLRPQLTDPTLRENLIRAHAHFRRAAEASVLKSGGDLPSFRRSVAVRMLNRASHMGLLYGPALGNEINERLEATRGDSVQRQDSLGCLLSEIQIRARTLLSDNESVDANSLLTSTDFEMSSNNHLSTLWTAAIESLDPSIYPLVGDRQIANAIASMFSEAA